MSSLSEQSFSLSLPNSRLKLGVCQDSVPGLLLFFVISSAQNQPLKYFHSPSISWPQPSADYLPFHHWPVGRKLCMTLTRMINRYYRVFVWFGLICFWECRLQFNLSTAFLESWRPIPSLCFRITKSNYHLLCSWCGNHAKCFASFTSFNILLIRDFSENKTNRTYRTHIYIYTNVWHTRELRIDTCVYRMYVCA